MPKTKKRKNKEKKEIITFIKVWGIHECGCCLSEMKFFNKRSAKNAFKNAESDDLGFLKIIDDEQNEYKEIDGISNLHFEKPILE